MKKYFVLFAAIAMIAGVLLLTGCSSRDADLVGVWTWEEDSSFVTTFNEDGTGTHAIDWTGMGTTFNWSTSGGNINWNYPNHPRVISPYSVSGNVLTLTIEGMGDVRYVR